MNTTNNHIVIFHPSAFRTFSKAHPTSTRSFTCHVEDQLAFVMRPLQLEHSIIGIKADIVQRIDCEKIVRQ